MAWYWPRPLLPWRHAVDNASIRAATRYIRCEASGQAELKYCVSLFGEDRHFVTGVTRQLGNLLLVDLTSYGQERFDNLS